MRSKATACWILPRVAVAVVMTRSGMKQKGGDCTSVVAGGVADKRLRGRQYGGVVLSESERWFFERWPEKWRLRPSEWSRIARFRPSDGRQTFILPFLDQLALYNTLNFKDPLPAPDATFQQAVATYRCPSDPTEKTNSMRSNYGTSNYSGKWPVCIKPF